MMYGVLKSSLWSVSLSALIALAGAAAALISAAAALGNLLLVRRRPNIVADLVAGRKYLNLIVQNVGMAVAYDVNFVLKEAGSCVLESFRDSAFLECGVRDMPPSRKYAVPCVSLTEEFWGRGLRLESPVVLRVKYYRRQTQPRIRRVREYCLEFGAHADDVKPIATETFSMDWN